MNHFLYCLILVFSLNVFATENTCENVLQRDTPFGKLGNGLTERGFLRSLPEATPELTQEAMKYLVMKWGLRIYPVTSEQEARKHSYLNLNRGLSLEEQ